MKFHAILTCEETVIGCTICIEKGKQSKYCREYTIITYTTKHSNIVQRPTTFVPLFTHTHTNCDTVSIDLTPLMYCRKKA